MKRSEQADKIFNLLEQKKFFEAKIELLVLRSLLRLDEVTERALKNIDETFQKVSMR